MRTLLLNWTLSASALTAAVLLLRAAFGRRIGARLRYALWLAVLARLLAPWQLYAAPVEVPQVLPEVLTVQTLSAPEGLPAEKTPPVQGGTETAPVPGEAKSGSSASRRTLDLPAALGGVWLAGSAVMAAAFLLSNAGFARRLRRVRVPLEADCPLRVYTAPGLPSPCLFGVFRPAVYVTPEASLDPTVLRHVLAHEATHYRHGDHIWAPLRCAALAVHWWNPLVWLAAVLSRRDAELACDEGTLRRLGDGERRAYGDTLLTLVTARPRPGDLLRCATTMTGDKRSLRERVRRIARAPKRWLWAAVLSAVLAVLVCACSFAKSETLETPEDGPLTEAELERFNTEIFNGDGLNMMNQFLFLAAEAPGDYRQIDLFQLFYNGTGGPMEVTEEERQAVADVGYGGEDPMVDLVRCPASEMDAVLQKYLGLTLDKTDQWCLDQFTYLEEYDAYYDFHGDTNYPGEVTFTSGEWKDGKVLLYYEGSGFPGLSSGNGEMNMVSSGPARVTLEPQKDGGYRFLSNWGWNDRLPATPTAYPAWEPERVIPLDGLEPYAPEKVTVERHKSDVAESFRVIRHESGSGNYDVEVYRSASGNRYAALKVSENERDCFLTIPYDAGAEHVTLEWYSDVCGHSGFFIQYPVMMGTYRTAWYFFDESGALFRLVDDTGGFNASDLDGDGQDELTWMPVGEMDQITNLLFQRDGQLYLADIQALLREAWPEAGYTDYGFWDADSRFLPLSAQVPVPGSDSRTATAFRTLFFDGESLRLYKDENGYTDHIANGLEALPADVVRQAAMFADTQFHVLAADSYGWDGSGRYDEGNAGQGNVTWDDWRITGLGGPWYETVGDIRVEIWNVGYETHTTTPDRVMLAGGSYLGEDGWCMIGYPGSDYLYFQLDENNERTYLFSKMENDCSPGTELFREDLIRALEAEGLPTPDEG